MYWICFQKTSSLEFESPSIKSNKMKMPALLEHVGVGLKLENNIASSCPSQGKWGERNYLVKRGIWRSGSLELLSLLGKITKQPKTSVLKFERDLLLDTHVTVITCFSFISFCTEKQPKAANLIHRRRDDKLKLIGGIRECSVRGQGFQPLLAKW